MAKKSKEKTSNAKVEPAHDLVVDMTPEPKAVVALESISESRHSILHLGDLKPDAANVRKHNPRNVGMIVDAINAVGPARSIVIDENNVILAGNATAEAMGEAGIETVRVIDRRPNEIVAVRVSGLTEAQKRHLAIADNRASDLSEFDNKELLLQLDEYHLDPINIGFTEDEISKLGDEVLAASGDPIEPGGVSLGDEKYMIVVTCRDESHQAELLEKLQADGLETRAIIG